MSKMTILIAVTHDRKVLLQTSQDDKALAYAHLDPETARNIADQLIKSADIAEGMKR